MPVVCFVLNTKTKKLTIFEAKTKEGLSVKGTTVQGFSESSVTKTIRKNNLTLLNNITEGRIDYTKRVINNIKTKKRYSYR